MALARHPGWAEGDVQPRHKTGRESAEVEQRAVLPLQDLDYADDMALISDLMNLVEEVSCSEMGLTISSEKTKILAIHLTDRPSYN